jgi:arabinofuranosyltransferase
MTIEKQSDQQTIRNGTMNWSGWAGSLPVLAFLSLFVVVVIRRAWICDDAYITFRTVENFINGYRLVWNIGERVQVYTHPLWMFLLSFVYFFTHEIYFTVLAVSIVVSVAAVIVLSKKVALSDAAAAFGIFLLVFSKAFVDFSTSGLENGLSHLILVIFFLIFFQGNYNPRKIFYLSLVASLGLVNRMDLGVVFLPALLYAICKSWNRRSILAIFLGQAPFILWELFSIFYYGFPFPNTAYAKLNTGISNWEYVQQGLLYLLDSLEQDPLTLLTILLGLITGVLSKDRRQWMAAIGIGLYLIYVVKVGGDFMSGRFLTVPLFLAVILLTRFDFSGIGTVPQLSLYGIALVVAFSVSNPTVRISDYGDLKQGPVHVGSHGVLDERMLYFGGTGLMNVERDHQYPDFYWGIYGETARVTKKAVADNYAIGLFGLNAGPDVYVLDKLALADPLLARIPATRSLGWRTGHMERILPDGYLQTLLSKTNSITDPNLHLYYDKLSLIVKGNLFDPHRMVEIWKMNTGQYDGLIDKDKYRYPEMVSVDQTAVSTTVTDGTSCADSGSHTMKDSGMEIRMSAPSFAQQLTAGLDDNDRYRLVFFHGEEELGSIDVATATLPEPGGIAGRSVMVPKKISGGGFDRIRILPLEGDGNYCLGYLLVDDGE